MKPGRVEKVVAVNENSDPAAVAEFPRRTSGRLELHCSDPQILSGLRLRCSYKLLSDMLRILKFLKACLFLDGSKKVLIYVGKTKNNVTSENEIYN